MLILSYGGKYKMKKILPIFIVGIFIASGLGTIAYQIKNDNLTVAEKICFSTPQIEDINQYISVTIKGANTCIKQPNRPILPTYKPQLVE